jgi:opacity protein-like surface antigen
LKTLQKAALLIYSIAAVPALAQGVYLGGGIGTSTQKNELAKINTEGGYLKAGYRFNDFIAAEYRFGGVNDNNSDLNLSQYHSLYMRGSYSLSDEVEIYGLLGASVSQIGGDAVTPGEATKDITSPSFGAGVRYFATENIGISAEYVATSTKKDYSLSGLFLSVDYQF